MSANRANIGWHLRNMIGGDDVPKYGEAGYCPGAVCLKTTGRVGLGIYINYGTTDSCDFISTDGLSAVLAGGSEQDIHETSLVQNYDLGSRLVVRGPGGNRTFHYAKASNIVSVRHFGLKFWNQIGDGLATTLAASSAIGSKTITIADAAATLNEYRGGYVTMFSTPVQTRLVVSNTVTDGTNTTLTLDKPLTTAVTEAATYTEVLHNIYSNVRLTAGPSGGDAGNDYSSVAGIPFVTTSAANTYLWLQTWGPIWINPHGSSLQDAGITGSERKLVFDCEGSITLEDDAAHGPCAGGEDMQHAGFIIDRSAAGTSGPPLVMLQVSP